LDAVPQEPDPVAPALDMAAQDRIVLPEKAPPKPAPKPAPKVAAKAPDFDSGALAALIDKSLPESRERPSDVSAFAKSIEASIPKAARVGPKAIASLEQAIRAQIAPCWNPPIGGADVAGMTAVLRIRLNRDGTVAASPEFVSQTGATSGNDAYARAFVETAKRAVLRCAPLELPDDLFSYWREFELNFDPQLLT
jgi:hypothetical protein